MTVFDLMIKQHRLSLFNLLFPLVSVSTENIHQTLETVFEHISQHLEGRENNSAALLASTLFSVFELHIVFHV